MTLFPTGDRGQRYEVSSIGYPIDGKMIMGWTEYLTSAEQMAGSFLKAPGCKRVEIRDRWRVEELRMIEREEAVGEKSS